MSRITRETWPQGDEEVRTQYITLTLRDVLNAAVQVALNDGNGLDAIGLGSRVHLATIVHGEKIISFTGGPDFDFERDDETGNFVALITEQADEALKLRLSITNTKIVR